MWLLFNRKLQQKREYFVDNIILGTYYPINLWKSLKNTLLCKLYICYFIRLQNISSYYVVFILIFGIGLPDYPMTIFGNTFQCKLFMWLLLNRKLQQKREYVVDNIIFEPFYPINLWKSLKTHFYVNYLFDFLLVVNNNKKWKFVVDNIILGTYYPINLWKC